MKKLFISILALCACAGTIGAAETVLLDETFATDRGEFTIENVNLPSSANYIWSFNTSYMKASAYLNNTANAADSWLISPAIDTRNAALLILTFDHAAKFQTGNLAEEFQLLVAKNPSSTFNAEEWTNVTIPNTPTAGTWTFVPSGDIDLSEYVGVENLRIAFRYLSTASAADSWEIKNVKIVADEYADGEAFYVYNSDGTTVVYGIAKVDSISFTRPGRSALKIVPTGTIDGYDYVDLGLPSGTLWATTNLGGASANSYGDYFAWGEISKKDTYSYETYTRLAEGRDSTYTKYCNISDFGKDGFTDALTTLETEDDAAAANWGGNWHLPDIDDWNELLSKCTLTWTIMDGEAGCVVKSTNGNAIFLPAAGRYYDNELNNASTDGYYWSSSLYTGDPSGAHIMYIGPDEQSVNYYSARYSGRSIRPVYSESYSISIASSENGTVVADRTSAPAGKTITLTATPNSGYALKSFSITYGGNEVTVTDKSFVMPEGDVVISAIFAVVVISGTENGHDYVDLGLPSGLRWATTNVGATNPGDYGNYYAYGEIATKSTYDWSTYKYANGSYSTLTKYNNSSRYGTVDNKTTLEAADDAATQNWGGAWRMPTIDEWQELIDSCTWTWTTLNGENGYEVKATNGNSIFLPAAGYHDNDELSDAGSGDYYWSSSLSTNTPYDAQFVYFGSDDRYAGSYRRSLGKFVRPVCE
jgi:uncharacterized protein (TIGR02145 family)